ncbi:ATP-grasp enzyme [Nakamurella flava]|uniref:ATP-grasp enzyme n=1 Tax=Nakamurella flava TaxID=2576308 RepID=A0A4U6QJM3_9ACTN|nr:ATP-grasp enzyme [Nakamurella flava]TKV60276.1 ATP-grasp enzyme [Nakamurella flava]
MTDGPPLRRRVASIPQTLGMIALLQALAPLDLAAVAMATLRRGRVPAPAPSGRTIMLSGGKMTKALELARCFHAAGHRVVLVESARYRFTAHRFSRAVAAFHVVPDAASAEYVDALVDVVQRERVDVYVPVCSPASSRYDALARATLQQWCEVLHGGPDDIETVDDKAAFAAAAGDLGLAVPDTLRVTHPDQVAAFDFGAAPGPYVLKSIAYDPVNRLDLTRLPRSTPEETAAFARSKPISADNPWILQQFVPGSEYCTHGTARDGRLRVFVCCASSASQLNYAPVDKPAIEDWVRTFVAEHRLTGQYSFDFIETADGTPLAIECNPRTHSAITLFRDHPDLAEAYLGETGDAPVRPAPDVRPTYWLHHELWQAFRHPRSWRYHLRVLREGRDAVFDPRDPWPFFLLYHLHLPSLLLQNLVRLRPWVKIDVNIGKLVEPAGD